MKNLLMLLACVCLMNCEGSKIPFPESSSSGLGYTQSKVLLVIWDGCQRVHLQELLASSSLPNLQSLIDLGMYRDMEIHTTNCGCSNDGDNYHTETGPGHSAMFTGYGFPAMNNHCNLNSVEWAERGCPSLCGLDQECYKTLGPNEIPAGYTIFERMAVEKPEVRQGIVTGKDLTFFPFPPLRNVLSNMTCSGAYEICGTNRYSPFEFEYITGESQKYGHMKAVSMIDRFAADPFFIIVHSYSPDGEGHAYGESSQQYTDSILRNDVQLGILLDKLEARNIDSETIVIVTTDHGFIENGIGHHYQCNADTKNIWIVSNHANVIGNMNVPGWQTALTPTLFDIFEMNKNVNPSFPSESLYLE